MIDIVDIKSKIDELSPEAFQEFCELFLRKKELGVVHNLGMKAGTTKTTQGQPDIYFRNNKGKYTLVECTTKKDDIFTKLKEDINICLDPSKTELPIEKIDRIICCHTSSNLSAGKDDELHCICEDNGVKLTILGIDEISNQLLYDYRSPTLYNYLGLPLEANQIMSIDDFISYHDDNTFAATINTTFQFREEEKNKILEELNENSIVIVNGRAGIGKTRLVLECVKEYANKNNSKALCLKSRNLNIHEELAISMENPDDYIIFVDDANELDGLNLVLDYTTRKREGYNVKVVITVRDYIKKDIEKETNHYNDVKTLTIQEVNDEQIKEFLEVNFGIKNADYVKQIIRLSEGNLRMAYIAGQLAVKENDLRSIRNAEQLYDKYYSNYMSDYFEDNIKLTCVAGILSVVKKINLENIRGLRELLNQLGISEDDFKEKTIKLSKMEFVVRKNSRIIISDQCLANYMLFYIFIKSAVIPLSTLLISSYSSYRNEIMQVVNVLLNIFDSESTRKICNSEILIAWNEFENNKKELYENFVIDYHIFRPDTSFSIVQEKIDCIKEESIDYNNINYKKPTIRDDSLLSMMNGYQGTDDIETVLSLLVTYCSKSEGKLVAGLNWLKSNYGITVNSVKMDYYTEHKISNYFLERVNDDNPVVRILAIEWALFSLEFEFKPSEWGRNNIITIYTIKVSGSEPLLAYRNICWELLISCCEEKNKIYSFLEKYAILIREESCKDIVEQEMEYIVKIVNCCKSNNINFMIAIEALMREYSDIGLSVPESWKSFLDNNKWRTFFLLRDDSHHSNMDYEEYAERRKAKLEKYGNELEKTKIRDFIINANQIVQEIESISIEHDVNEAVGMIANGMLDDVDRLLSLVEIYIEEGDSLSVYPERIMRKLQENYETEGLYQLLDGKDYKQKNVWQYYFFMTLPVEQINKRTFKYLLRFIKDDGDKKIEQSSYRSLQFLEAFNQIKPKAFLKVCRIIYKKRKYSEFIVGIYFDRLFFEGEFSPEKLEILFKSDKKFLKELYFYLLDKDGTTDYKGIYLSYFLQHDDKWLEPYSEYLISDSSRSKDYNEKRIEALWKINDYNLIMNYLLKKIVEVDLLSWEKSRLIKSLIRNSTNQQIIELQQKWLLDVIKEYAQDDIIVNIFEAIVDFNSRIKLDAMRVFINYNDSTEIFEKIPLVVGNFSIVDKSTAEIEKKIEYLNSLIEVVNGIKYLKHREIIKKEIKYWQDMKDHFEE